MHAPVATASVATHRDLRAGFLLRDFVVSDGVAAASRPPGNTTPTPENGGSCSCRAGSGEEASRLLAMQRTPLIRHEFRQSTEMKASAAGNGLRAWG